MTITKVHLKNIRTRLAEHRPEQRQPDNRGHAAVAMLLKDGLPTPEVLFIIRAEHAQDPWSGNIAFPGGRLNSPEETAQQAAMRETHEELGLDLGRAQLLGQLDDLYGATLPVLVSCFVYLVEEFPNLRTNHEVATTFWYSLDGLLDPARHRQQTFSYRNRQHLHPVVELLEPHQPLLWGITYRLIRNFFELCEIDFGAAETSGSATI